MEFKIVNLEKKIIAGVSANTGNTDPKMGEIIGGLWTEFYQNGINVTVKNRTTEYAIGLYSEYTNEGAYCITVGNEVSEFDNDGLSMKIIPAGKYAKFSVCGNMVTAVADAWSEIWKLNLDRSFTGDFEEYLNASMDDANIDIYIALK